MWTRAAAVIEQARAIKALLRLYSGSIKALSSRRVLSSNEGSIKALLRLYYNKLN